MLIKTLAGNLDIRNALGVKSSVPPIGPLTLLQAPSSFVKDLAAKGLATQSVVLGPAASTSCGNLLELQLLRSPPRPAELEVLF